MKTTTLGIHTLILKAVAMLALVLVSASAPAAVVDAIYHAASDVPVTANGYTATGNTVNFTLNFAPAPGTELMVVNNTGLAFINGTFGNLTNGQVVSLSYGGTIYNFVANYNGGTGNDLVLAWASQRLLAWGKGTYGQLGDNSFGTNRLLPVPVMATGVLAGKTVVAVSAGRNHTVALCSDDTVAAWGWNYDGELGYSTAPANSNAVPGAVSTAAGVSALYGKRVVAVAAGASHSLALCSDGAVAAWGDNMGGEPGDNHGSGYGSVVPVAVDTAPGESALYGKTVVAIAAGGGSGDYYTSHNLALCSDGTVAAWGYNHYGQVGNSTIGNWPYPVAVNRASGVSALYQKTVTAVAAGSLHSLALCSEGTLAAWGCNDYGQLGDNTTTQRTTPVAVNTASGISALYGKTVVAIAAGDSHSLALCSDGTLVAWGCNDHGQLGDNTTTRRNAPVAVNTAPGVSALCGKAVVAVAAGAQYSLAVCSDGTVAGWGYNYYGQLGDGTTTEHHAPAALDTGSLGVGERFTSIARSLRGSHSLGLVARPAAPQGILVNPSKLADGSFSFSFTDSPGAAFSVRATTDPTLPLSNWTSLGAPVEICAGQFQFTDPQASTNQVRFYRVSTP